MPDVDNLSIPMGGGAGERLPVWIRTRPSARVPDLDRNIAQSQAQMAIALWLITLAFGPASIRNRWFVDSPLERDGFELPVREHRAMAPSHGFAAASHREAALRG